MDIIIVCMNQNKKIPPIVEGYYLERMFKKREKKTYESDIYVMCNSINGTLYDVFSYEQYKDNDLIAGTYDIVDTLSTKTRDSYFILDEKDQLFLENYPKDYDNYDYSYSSIYFLKDHESRFKKLINYVINCSETSSCLILIREPLESPEKIVGPISVDKFFEMVKRNKIYTNIEYILKK